MIFMPPRHGKSELVSRRLPAYLLGVNPDCKIIAASYSDSLASLMNRDTQRIMDSSDYHEVFPKTMLAGNIHLKGTSPIYKRTSELFEVVDYEGSYRSVGIGGGIVGMGADFAIIDDPIKNQQEADSPTYRDKVWEWYQTVLYSRLEKDDHVLLTVTRWHEDDLPGRLLKLAKESKDADKWEVITFPAVAEGELHPGDPRKPGDALWPWKYNETRLTSIKASLNAGRFWQALYQQRPSTPEGGMVQRSWIKFYREAPSRFDEIIQSWDLTFKGGPGTDFTVGQVWGRKGANKYLLDRVRAHMDFPSELTAMRTLSAKWPDAHVILVEEAANGAALIATLKDEIPGLIAVRPKTSKAMRLSAVSGAYEAGNVWYPDPSIAPWVHDEIEELVSFPNAANDDTVDATTQALMRFQIGNAGVMSEDYVSGRSILGDMGDSW